MAGRAAVVVVLSAKSLVCLLAAMACAMATVPAQAGVQLPVTATLRHNSDGTFTLTWSAAQALGGEAVVDTWVVQRYVNGVLDATWTLAGTAHSMVDSLSQPVAWVTYIVAWTDGDGNNSPPSNPVIGSSWPPCDIAWVVPGPPPTFGYDLDCVQPPIH